MYKEWKITIPVLTGEEEPLSYTGIPVFQGFDD